MQHEDTYYSTEECADRLNLAYGWKVMTRRGILREIRSGKLPVNEVPANGSRQRALIKVPRKTFLDYCLVYHRDVATAIRVICNN